MQAEAPNYLKILDQVSNKDITEIICFLGEQT